MIINGKEYVLINGYFILKKIPESEKTFKMSMPDTPSVEILKYVNILNEMKNGSKLKRMLKFTINCIIKIVKIL